MSLRLAILDLCSNLRSSSGRIAPWAIAGLLGSSVGSYGCSDDTTTAHGDASAAPDGGGDASQSETASDTNNTDGSVDADPVLARGEYLVRHLLVCGDCHTPIGPSGAPDFSKAFAGGTAFPVGAPGPDGGVPTVYSRNITSDVATGIGSWSVAQIKTAITTGVDDMMMPLFPVMPYWIFHNLTDADATAVATFIKALPPISHTVPTDTASVPGPAPALDLTKVPKTSLAASDPNFASANNGQYLSQVVCIDCHTKQAPPGPGQVLDLSMAFAGGQTFGPGVVSANITPDNATGLGSWMTADVIATLKTAKEKGTGRKLAPVMPAGPGRFGDLTDGDLKDIANYIHTIPPIVNNVNGTPDGGAGDSAPAPDGGTADGG